MAHRTGRRISLAVCTAAFMALPAAPAFAQAWPVKPVRLVLAFPAGSATDTVVRPYAEHMSATLGQNVLIDARPGGGGMVASLHVKSQPPDGYTMFYASNTVVVRSVVPNAQIDARRDYAPVAPTSVSPLIIAVNAEQSRATTVKELIDEARAKPGQLNYSSYGVGSGAHMFMEMLLYETKAAMVHVPYQGTVQATADTASGRVQVTGTILATLRAHVASLGGSGKVRMIAISLGDRSSLVPELPGMKDAGYPNLDYPLWGGVLAPAGTPRNIVDTMNRAINAAYRDPKMSELAVRFGQMTVGGSPEDLARIINREFEAYSRLVKETGLKLE